MNAALILLRSLLALCLLVFCAGVRMVAGADATGDTEFARWAENKKACFLLMFDDSWPSHWQVAVPELAKRQMTATFYINPDKGEYKVMRQHWEGDNAVWKQGMAYGNHTMTHNGIQNPQDGDWEISECTNVIRKTVPGPQKRLVSWGRPGVKDWNVSNEQLQEILTKNLLISRPTFDGHGVVYHLKTTQQMLTLADKAIKDGGMEYLIAHGVERGPEIKMGYQDFWAWKLQQFREVLDGLAERRDRGDLWITDHISYYQYQSERDKAKLTVLEKTPATIRLRYETPELDGELYNLPLTLRTRVPADWKTAQVVQNEKKSVVAVTDGIAQYAAQPGAEIVLTPVR